VSAHNLGYAGAQELFSRPSFRQMPLNAEPSHGALLINQSMSEGPLDPAHDAVAEVFCDVDGRHLVQVGITDFFGDLLSPSYAVVFAIDHELRRLCGN